MTPDRPRLGRAKVVLVQSGARGQQAVVSTIVARAENGQSPRRLTFGGPLAFDRRAASHLRKTVLPVIDDILALLNIRSPSFEVSIANLGATAAAELDTQVSGFSADLPAMLAFLSAALGIAVPDDLVCTGHIASPNGEIRAVKSIRAKLEAAVADPDIRSFIHPSIRDDMTLAVLSPLEAECAESAILEARDRIRTIAVGDVSDLVRAVFNEDQVVLASMNLGYFENHLTQSSSNHPAGRAARFLAADGVTRFWKCAERHLLAGSIDTVKQLLDSYTVFHLGRQLYPKSFGRKLMLLLRSLPPAERRLRNMFPLIGANDCIKLSQFATSTDHEDVSLLLDAAAGRHVSLSDPNRHDSFARESCAERSRRHLLDTVLSRVRAESLAQHIGLPIDNARATYTSETITVESQGAFNESVNAFYLHLMRHTHSTGDSIHRDAVAGGAHALLDEAFARRGGYKAAFAEARDGTRGGLRFVFDVLTEQLKVKSQHEYVNLVFREAIDALELSAQLELIKELLDQLQPALPPELRNEPPEHFVNDISVIVRAYVRSLDQFNEVLRSI